MTTTLERTPLASWLTDVKRRHATITTDTTGGPCITPSETATEHDRQQLKKYEYALITAATGTNPEWWAYVTNKTDTPPRIHQTPLNGDGWACWACGKRTYHINDNGRNIRVETWCDIHNPHETRNERNKYQ